jgi:hypothetical protein
MGRQTELIRHRWQRDWNAQPLDQLRTADIWQRFRIGGLLVLFLGLTALLVHQLWFRPVQTPMVAMAAPAYAWPLPPNAWAAEDIDGFAKLDAQESIRLTDISPAWQTAESGLASFDRQLHTLAQQGSPSGSVIFYVSMHGIADAAGRPVLLPPGASPLRSETWLKLSDLLEHIKAQQLPDAWHKLLILDCNRIDVNWRMGVLADGFADGLADAVRESGIPNFAILNSASPGERAWASGDLAASVFGHYLRLGLAGAADAKLEDGKLDSPGGEEGGNGDHRVSLRELLNYLDRHVDAWAQHNRSARQRPMLVPASAEDFTVVWALNPHAQKKLAERAAADAIATPATLTAASEKLWRSHDRLGELNPQRFDPLAWSDFEHKLLWADQAIAAGAAYRTPVRTLQRQLQSFTDRIEAQAAQLKNPLNILARSERFSDHTVRRPTSVVTHWIPLARYMTEPDAGFADWTAKLAALEKSPSQTAVADFLAGLPPREHAGQFVEVHFLRLLQAYLPSKAWQQPAVLSRALQVQAHGDRAAVADDERGQFWSLPVATAGNRQERAARDQLFIGNDAALAGAGPQWDAAEDDYAKAERLTHTVGDALAIRDRAWGEIPYFAAWLARPLPVGESADAADQEINSTLLHLIRTAHSLDGTLASPPTTEAAAATESPPFEGEAREVRERLDRLEQLVAKECNRLQEIHHGDGRALRDLQAVLEVASVPARQREQLRKRAEEIASRLNRESAADDALAATTTTAAKVAGDKSARESDTKNDAASAKRATAVAPKAPADREPDGSDYRHRAFVVWEQHPALAILESAVGAGVRGAIATDEDGNQAAKSTAKAHNRAMVGDLERVCIDYEHRVRERLDAIAGEVRRLRDAGAGTSAGSSPAEVSPSVKLKELIEGRAPHSRAEQLVRSAAGIGLPALDDDPVRRLRQWDLQHLLLWHCRRTLEDFWGPAQPAEPPFFIAAASDSLRGVQAIGEAEPAVLAESNRLAKMLQSRRQAAAAGLDTVASDVLLIEESDEVKVKMAVQPGPEVALHGLPTSQAAVFIRDARGRIEGTSRALDLPLTDVVKGRVPVDMMVSGAALAGRGPILEAVALVRGNRFSTNFLLRPTGGVKIDVEPYHYGLPQITLGGRSRRRASIMFILDCSNSMSEPTDLEGPGGTEQVPRLEAAKIALKQMLSGLADEGDARVGVIFYGHRVGWNLKKPDEILRQSDYARPIPDDLRPSEDVELVLPLGRFDQVVAGGVFDLMKSLKPWGETPLYLSVVGAIGDFAHDEPGTEKTIVVITDGLNYQFNSPNPKTRQDVLAAMGDHKIPIEIVGFGISDKEAAAAAREFNALAQETGGSYVPVSSGTALVHSLESLLGPKGYEVADASGGAIGHAAMGTTVTVRPKPAGMKTYTVSLSPLSTQVELAGGERAELTISADGRSIQSVGYQHGQPQFGSLIAGDRGSPTEWQLGVHRPIRNAEGASFPISVQRADRRFAPRMAEAWIEITPHADDPHTVFPTYIFYDANWELGMPAPVLKLLAENWPVAAKQAEVSGWLKQGRTPPDWVVKLGDVVNRVPTSGSGATLNGLSGVTYQVRAQRGEKLGDPYRVAVIERFADDSAGPGSLKVEIYPQPTRIQHRFDPQNHLATDNFDLDEADDKVVATYELRFTRSETVKRGALQLAEPIVRGVSETGDLIRP